MTSDELREWVKSEAERKQELVDKMADDLKALHDPERQLKMWEPVARLLEEKDREIAKLDAELKSQKAELEELEAKNR